MVRATAILIGLAAAVTCGFLVHAWLWVPVAVAVFFAVEYAVKFVFFFITGPET